MYKCSMLLRVMQGALDELALYQEKQSDMQ